MSFAYMYIQLYTHMYHVYVVLPKATKGCQSRGARAKMQLGPTVQACWGQSSSSSPQTLSLGSTSVHWIIPLPLLSPN